MSNKEQLIKMESSKQYVFHGSPASNIEVLEPRQSTHVPDLKDPDKIILDGKPAVSATPYLDIAIFRAIVNSKNINYRPMTSGFGYGDKGLTFSVSSKEILDEAYDNKEGFVYVFDRDGFKPYRRDGKVSDKHKETTMEWRSHKDVSPVSVVKVLSKDLPEKDSVEISD